LFIGEVLFSATKQKKRSTTKPVEKGNAKNSSMERKIKILCYAIDYFVAMYKYTALEYIFFCLLPSTTLILFHTACYFLYFILYIIIIPLLFICLCSVFFFASSYLPCDFVIHSKKCYLLFFCEDFVEQYYIVLSYN
jgi:hypothetical protein